MLGRRGGLTEIAQPDAAPLSPPLLHADQTASDIKTRLRARRQPAPASLLSSTDYVPDVAARLYTIAEAPPEPFRLAPVKTQAARFDPRVDPVPPFVAGRLAMMKATEAVTPTPTVEMAER